MWRLAFPPSIAEVPHTIKSGNGVAMKAVQQDVLTVVDSSMQHRISMALQNVTYPVHLNSVKAALAVTPL